MSDSFKAHHHAAIIATLSLLSTGDANMVASYFNFMVQGMETWAELGLGSLGTFESGHKDLSSNKQSWMPCDALSGRDQLEDPLPPPAAETVVEDFAGSIGGCGIHESAGRYAAHG